MKHVVWVLAFLMLPSTAMTGVRAESPAFTWTVSASDQDPYVNTSAPWHGIKDLYVWVIPREGVGLTASHFDMVANGDLMPVLIQSINGFVNPGAPPQCGWIYATFCQETPVAAAFLQVWSAGIGGALCMTDCYGTNCSTSCVYDDYANSYIGFSSDGSAPCVFTTHEPCSPVSADAGSWGSIKANYR